MKQVGFLATLSLLVSASFAAAGEDGRKGVTDFGACVVTEREGAQTSAYCSNGEEAWRQLLRPINDCQVRCPDGSWVRAPCGSNENHCAESPPPPPEPDYCDRHPERCAATPSGPTQLDLQNQTFRTQLTWFQQYFNVTYFSSAQNPSSEAELSARLDQFFSYAVRAYLSLYRDVGDKIAQADNLERANAELRKTLLSLQTSVAGNRSANAELEGRVVSTEAQWHRLQEQGGQLSAAALKLANEREVRHALISYIKVFGRDPDFLRAQFDAEITLRGWNSTILPPESPGLQPASLVPRGALNSAPGLLVPGPASPSLNPNAGVDAKLAEIDAQYRRHRLQNDYLSAANTRIAAANSEQPGLQASVEQARVDFDGLLRRASELQDRFAIADRNLPVARSNRAVAARALGVETVLALAKVKTLDTLKNRVDRLVGVSGVASTIPTSAEDLVVRAAKEGRRIVIPTFGYTEQWNAFLKVQKQTATLVQRSKGYVSEAARLCAEGTPDEIERHIKKVFGSLEAEAAEYTATVGFSDLPERERSLWQKALLKFISDRKFQEEDE